MIPRGLLPTCAECDGPIRDDETETIIMVWNRSPGKRRRRRLGTVLLHYSCFRKTGLAGRWPVLRTALWEAE